MTKAGDNRIRRLYTMDNLPVLRRIDWLTITSQIRYNSACLSQRGPL